MKYEDYQKIKWLSIYGASITVQSYDFLQDKKIKAKAVEIANLALEGDSL
jgi:hypothetical protein